MNRRVVTGIVLTLLVVALAATVGWWAYSMGLAQGALQSTQIVVPEGAAPDARVYPWAAAPFYHYGPGFGRMGWGLGPLGCLFPILGFFLLFALLRLAFGGWGRRGWGYGGGWGHGGGWKHHGPPPMFEEWHRRAHGEGESAPTPPPANP